MKRLIACVAAACVAWTAAAEMPDVDEIVLPGQYQGHLQDVWWDGGESIYWAHTWDIVKTDLAGNVLRHVTVEGHNAGCQLKDGKLYVAVCPTSGSSIVAWTSASRLQVNEYDADTLALVDTHVLPANDRAGSLAVLADGSFVVGCLRPGDISASQVRFHRVGADFTILSTHLVDGLKIEMGIETIRRYGGSLFLMCYGAPIVRLDATTFAETGRMDGSDGTRGLIYDGRHIWRGVSTSASGVWTSKLVRHAAGSAERAFFETTDGPAATYTWTGGEGDGLFSTPGNWRGGVAPTAATADDSLAFTLGGVVTNDIAGLTVGDVGVTLASGTKLTVFGEKFGGSGTLTKDGAGTLLFSATNAPDAEFSHAVAVNGGIFQVDKTGDFHGALTVADGGCMLCSDGTVNFHGPVEIVGVSTNTGAQLHYYAKVRGNPACANAGNTTHFHGGLDGVVTILGSSGGNGMSGQAVFYEDTSCFHGFFRTTGECAVNGNTGELVRKAGNMLVGNRGDCVIGGITVSNQHNFGVFGDGIGDVVTITNSTISVTEAFSAGRVGPGANKSIARLGAGTTVTAAYVLTGYNLWPNYGAIEILDGAVVNVTNRICAGYHLNQSVPPKGPTNEWITVDGGTLNAEGIGIGIGGEAGPTSRFYLKKGTVNAEGVYLKAFRAKGAASSRGTNCVGGTNTYRFVMTGGTFNMGEWGIVSLGCEDNSEANVILAGGTMNATKDFPIPYYNPTLFGYGNWRGGAEGGFTLNTAGHAVTLNTALNGMGDVRLTGNGTVAGTNAIQGVLGGRWTVDGGMSADLRGAASLLGGLSVGANAAVTLDVGAERSAAFFTRDGSWEPTSTYEGRTVISRFNKSDGGTVSTLISHDMDLLNVTASGVNIPTYAGGTREAMVSKGEFYVAPEEAGTWTFSGIWTHYIHIQIDDESATSTGSKNYAHLQTALSEGWHRFVIIGIHTSGTCGPNSRKGMAVGFAKRAVSGNAAADYTLFSPKNLKMRPSAPCGGEASVRWSTVKGTKWAETTWAKVSNSNYTNNWDWDVVCLTNSLRLLDLHGKGYDRLNTNVVNRWDGWFHVPSAKAGTWRFRLLYDDRVALFLDGARVAATAAYNAAVEEDVPVTPGWHRYEICTFDGSGSFGPGEGSAVSYAVSADGGATFGAFAPFNEDSLTLSLAPDGYLQGEIALASGAAVTNVSETAAVVWGDVKVANGAAGAVMSGKFACVSNTVDFGTVAANTDDLTKVLKFDDAATNLFADVGKIAVDFASSPTFGRALVGPAGGLDALSDAELARRFEVTVDGVPAADAKCIILPRVQDGRLYLRNLSGTTIYVR